MAILAPQIDQIEGGFVKEIDEGSMRMIFENMQKTQYSYPYKSTVRELASNAIDAIREREIALSILAGKTRVEDHYVFLEGDEYKASKFDPNYYDPQWLSKDPNVYIIYEEGGPLDKDKIIIRDHGVGLWGDRLVGYFKLSYSTKRLSRFGLGKYGIGAKAPLSTGNPFFTVINRYNGRELRFDIYLNKLVSTTPRFDMATGKENPMLVMNNGFKCYYTRTEEKNGLEVIVTAKKHHKQQYIDAVKSQLLYFDNVVFKIISHDGRVEQIPVKADILYEDDIMILSDNKMYTKPHLLINRVNYGNIDFVELELEDKLGNISIKMQPEEVSVSPSREHVLWDEMTRESVVKRFKEVQAVSEQLLQKELNQDDFMKWLRACIAVKNKLSTERSDSIVARLARLVDLNNYVPVYKPDPQFKLDRTLFAGVSVRKITSKQERQGSHWKWKVDRSPATLSDLVDESLPILIQTTDTNWLRDRYLLDDVYPGGFITIWLNNTEVQKPEVTETVTEEDAEKIYQSRKSALHQYAKNTALELKLLDSKLIDVPQDKEEEAVQKVYRRWEALNKYILASSEIDLYEKYTVPEGYSERYKDKGEEDNVLKEEDEVQTKEAKLSAEARRKLEGKTILFTPRFRVHYKGDDKYLYEWHKLEIPVTEIDEWSNEEVYYSSEDSASLLFLAALITRPGPSLDSTLLNESKYSVEARLTAYNPKVAVRLVKVAQNRVKYYQDFKHIQKFFAEIKNKTLTMSNTLIKWNTARYLHSILPRLRFLSQFAAFSDYHASKYQQLKAYSEKHYREVEELLGEYKELTGPEYEDMTRHMDRVMELQLFAREHKDDPVAVANVVKELFGIGMENVISDGCAIDTNIYDIAQELLEYAEPIQLLLNQVNVLTSSYPITMSEELQNEIRAYIQFKRGDL